MSNTIFIGIHIVVIFDLIYECIIFETCQMDD